MYRKMFGVLTAVAAALLLVGVAWASGDAEDDNSSSGSIASSVTSEQGASVTVSSDATGTSADDDSSTRSSVDTTSGTASDDTSSSTTSVTAHDNSSTSTTIDDNDGTIDDRDDDDVETRAPAPLSTGPTSYSVGAAGTVTVQVESGSLILLDISANSGWRFEIDESGGRDIKIEFDNGDNEAEFEAKLRDGEIRIEVEDKD